MDRWCFDKKKIPIVWMVFIFAIACFSPMAMATTTINSSSISVNLLYGETPESGITIADNVSFFKGLLTDTIFPYSGTVNISGILFNATSKKVDWFYIDARGKINHTSDLDKECLPSDGSEEMKGNLSVDSIKEKSIGAGVNVGGVLLKESAVMGEWKGAPIADAYVADDISANWSKLVDKPTEFTPSIHNHLGGEIVGSVGNANDSVSFGGQLPSYYLNASNLDSGVVPSYRLLGNYTSIGGLGTITTGMWEATAISDSYISDYLTIGGGSINASIIDTGTIADARISSNITRNSALDTINEAITSHSNDKNNPHSTNKTQLGLDKVENVAVSAWNGSSNLVNLGMITTGNWQATAISDAYLSDDIGANWSKLIGKPRIDEDSTDDLTNTTVFSGDVSGTCNATIVGDNSHSHNASTITIAGENITSGTISLDRLPSIDNGGGHTTILAWAYDHIDQGTWSTDSQGIGLLEAWTTNVGANGDGITYKTYLSAGTYTLLVGGWATASAGKFDVSINGTVIASGIDCYNAFGGAVFVNRTTGVAISTPSIYEIVLTVNGKNAASSNYRLFLQTISLWRTA